MVVENVGVLSHRQQILEEGLDKDGMIACEEGYNQKQTYQHRHDAAVVTRQHLTRLSEESFGIGCG